MKVVALDDNLPCYHTTMFWWLSKQLVMPQSDGGGLLTGMDELRCRYLREGRREGGRKGEGERGRGGREGGGREERREGGREVHVGGGRSTMQEHNYSI